MSIYGENTRSERHSLKNRLRYLLSHRVGFSIWEINGALCGGLTAWRFQKRTPFEEGELRRLPEASNDLFHLHPAGWNLRSQSLEELVSELFRLAEAPIELDDLVSTIADLLKIKEERQQTEDETWESEQASPAELLPDERTNPALDIERRLELKRLWIEICVLPVLWGDEVTARERFRSGVSGLRLKRRLHRLMYHFSAAETAEFFRLYYGPTSRAFENLDARGQASLRLALERLWSEHNLAPGGTSTHVAAEYLEVVARRV